MEVIAKTIRMTPPTGRAVAMVNTLRPRRNEQHFADDIFKRIFLNENIWFPITISLKFVPRGLINNIPALVQIMAWRRPGDKPLSDPMMVSLPTYIYIRRSSSMSYLKRILPSFVYDHHSFISTCFFCYDINRIQFIKCVSTMQLMVVSHSDYALYPFSFYGVEGSHGHAPVWGFWPWIIDFEII